MEYSQKMYLVPQQQLDRFKQQQQTRAETSINRQAQTDLDKAMAAIWDISDMDMNEKAKQYAKILQQYLSLVRQDGLDKSVLTLSLPTQQTTEHRSTETQAYDSIGGGGSGCDGIADTVAHDVLKHIPKRSKKKLSKFWKH